MNQTLIDEYDREVVCVYRGERYRVRDNGVVYRTRRDSRRRRPLDERWTFGRPSSATGYMMISSTPVHRIVATAFQGENPSPSHVVDHIDTNRRNNRPENLRWVTRLENVILNPITAKRIELAYGSLENFFLNPSKPLNGKLDPNFDWMRTVTAKEAQASRGRLLAWAEANSTPSSGTIGKWLFGLGRTPQQEVVREEIIVEARTPGAIQRNWKTPSEFSCCPSTTADDALIVYAKRLEHGAIFARNDFGESTVVSAEMSEDCGSLLVLGNNGNGAVKDWSLARVTIEDERFVHEGLGTFFSLEGATKQFYLARGLPWEGEDSIDDYC